MISTPNRASCFATMIFSSTFMLAPGDCSPSRNVVSKIRIMRVMVSPLSPQGRSKQLSGAAAASYATEGDWSDFSLRPSSEYILIVRALGARESL
jgi:hypothetical protein